MNFKITLACCFLLGCFSLSAQLLSRQQMFNDIDELETDLLEIHPGLDTYESCKAMPKLFAQTKSSLPDSLDRIEFLLHIAPLLDSVKCGHTGFNLYRKKLFKKLEFKGLIPLHIGEVDGHVLIRRNMTNDTVNIVTKTELLEIDGEPIHSILNKLQNVNLGSDAENQTGRINYALRNFRLAYRLFYGERDSFDLKIRQIENDSIIDVRIAGKTVEEMTETIVNRYRIRPVGPYKLRSVKNMDDVAILDVNRFKNTSWDPFQWKYRKRLKRIFKTLKERNIQHLIIDVRNNPGGIMENVIFLNKLLYDQRFVLIKDAGFNKKYFKSDAHWASKLAYRLRGTKKKESYIRFRPYSGKKYRPKKKWAYDGNVIVLLNEGSFSAACTFALFTKSNDRGILLGQEAGGSYHTVTAGSSHITHLPNSDLDVRIPIIRFDYEVDSDRQSHLRGVMPDIEVPRNLDDYLDGVDTQMEAALELIRKFEQKK